MPSPVTTAKNALMTALAAALPGRTVTRNFLKLGQRQREQLVAGVVSVVGLGESDYATHRGREADLGKLQMVLVGQLQVDSADPQAVEDAEDEMADQIKAFLAGPMPTGVRSCIATGYRQSGQLEAPYGWVAFEVEVRT